MEWKFRSLGSKAHKREAGGLVFFPVSSESEQVGPVARTFLLTMAAKCPKVLHCLPAQERLRATSSFEIPPAVQWCPTVKS